MPTSVLYCCDPLVHRRVDEHFASEARAVRGRGATVGLIDHDALLRGDAAGAVSRVPRDLGPAWYRGWMIPADRYAEMAEALRDRGCDLIVAPERYRAAHELPGWYPAFRDLTPASVWRPCVPREIPDDLPALAARLRPGAGIVKDYVKSRKHEWDKACFIPDLADADAVARVVAAFVELQDDSLAGGIVLREFEPFDAAEVRVWWLDGRPALVTPHPDSPETMMFSLELEPIEAAVHRLACRFVTTDIARRDDGYGRVVEVGDGQVSDLHSAVDRAEIAALLVGAIT